MVPIAQPMPVPRSAAPLTAQTSLKDGRVSYRYAGGLGWEKIDTPASLAA